MSYGTALATAQRVGDAGPLTSTNRSNHLNKGLPHSRVDAMRTAPIHTGGPSDGIKAWPARSSDPSRND